MSLNLSLELYVPRKTTVQDFLAKWLHVLTDPTIDQISLTRGTGSDYCEATNLSMLQGIRAMVPHKPVISHITLSHLEPDTLNKLEAAGIEHVLVLQGDKSPSAYAHDYLGLSTSQDFLAHLAAEYPRFKVHVSGHPYHRDSNGLVTRSESSHVARKLQAAPAGAEVGMITQWTVSLDCQLAFLNATAGLGRLKPRIGYFPFKDFDHAVRVAQACQLPLSSRDIQSLRMLEELGDDYDWLEKFRADLWLCRGFRHLDPDALAGIHLFSMNNLTVAESALRAFKDFQQANTTFHFATRTIENA